MKVWMRGERASRSASHARSMSLAGARRAPATAELRRTCATPPYGFEISVRGDGKNGLTTSMPISSSTVAMRSFSLEVHRAAGCLLAVAQVVSR